MYDHSSSSYNLMKSVTYKYQLAHKKKCKTKETNTSEIKVLKVIQLLNQVPDLVNYSWIFYETTQNLKKKCTYAQ